MKAKSSSLKRMSILSLQLLCFWLAVGYGSCFFLQTIPAQANDGVALTFAIPHKQLWLFANLITFVSIIFSMVTLWVKHKTAKVQLIRLYRPQHPSHMRRGKRY